MLDNFKEEVIVKRNRGLNSLMYGISWVFIVIFGLYALLNFSAIMNGSLFTEGGFNWISLVITVVFGGLAYLLWRYKDNYRTEYEYTFTNGDLDVSKVLGNSRRKYLTSLPMKNVESAGRVTESQLSALCHDEGREEAQLVPQPRKQSVLLLLRQKLGKACDRDRTQ